MDKFCAMNPNENLRNMGVLDLRNGIGELGGFAWFSSLELGGAPFVWVIMNTLEIAFIIVKQEFLDLENVIDELRGIA